MSNNWNKLSLLTRFAKVLLCVGNNFKIYICLWQAILRKLWFSICVLKAPFPLFFFFLAGGGWGVVRRRCSSSTDQINQALTQKIVGCVYIPDFVELCKTKTVASVHSWTLASSFHLTLWAQATLLVSFSIFNWWCPKGRFTCPALQYQAGESSPVRHNVHPHNTIKQKRCNHFI